MSEKLKVIVLTQNDRFYIPKNIYKAAQVCELMEVVEVQCKSAMDNRLSDYYKWFGFWQCAKMGVKTIGRELLKYLDRLCGYKLQQGFCSVRDVAAAMGVPHRVITDSNAADFVEHIREMQPDLIVSFSAPQIIREPLLSMPRHGIINVHGSLLPDYRGCFPSFWYVFNGEKLGGATVHYMSAAIDDGLILNQGTVDLSQCKSIFQAMAKTKTIGGELIVKTILDIQNGTLDPKPNKAEEGRYFTWPTIQQAKEFRAKGCKLI